jgi:predicted enzyme related to lactoylglutathione lyase
VKIKLTSVFVDDQEKALHFYTDMLGFTKKNDFSQGPYRWLTVAPPDEPNGTELRIRARGAEFTMPPTDVTGSTIAMLNDTCGNLIQITQLRWG